MHSILQIGISRNTKCVDKVGFPKSGHMHICKYTKKSSDIVTYYACSKTCIMMHGWVEGFCHGITTITHSGYACLCIVCI